ncbi:MAG: hypothetical protein PGN16_13695 [Sphingomonas phyllosphaerae]|uniref:hypothetical protein n=1 Tax=Sphingomonas phyllosphaerae TaxID=257003 RepID=UPI002FF5BBF6
MAKKMTIREFFLFSLRCRTEAAIDILNAQSRPLAKADSDSLAALEGMLSRVLELQQKESHQHECKRTHPRQRQRRVRHGLV